jgi:hypothetical protein
MRHLIAVMLAAVAAVACSTAPGEPTGTTTQAVTTCSSGYEYQCHLIFGHDLCGCVAVPCNWVIPPPPTTPPTYGTVWAEAWAVQTPSGACPEIETPTGTWAELGSIQGPPPGPPLYFNGIPDEAGNCFGPNSENPSQTCASMLDGGSCCTYVWWPRGYPNGPPSSWAPQDSQALCTFQGRTIVALQQPTVTPSCPAPGSGTCGTCGKTYVPPPP